MNGRVVGIDPSLTGTGVAVAGDEITVQVIDSTGHTAASLTERWARMTTIRARVSQIVRETEPALVVIEAPALDARHGAHLDRDGLWWMLVDEMFLGDISLVAAPPKSVKKFATGNGNASKDQMVAALARAFPDVDLIDNNGSDALAMAAFGRELTGESIWPKPLTKKQLAALPDWSAR